MESFRDLQRRTHCPFARTARIVLAPDWQHDRTYTENVAHHAGALRSFVQTGTADRHHGFVAGVGVGGRYRDFSAVRAAFGDYLLALGATDESCDDRMRADRLDRDWQFTYSGCRMFLNVFAACYPKSHSKFIDTESLFYVFFQPEYSFQMCGAGPLAPGVKHEIRKRFKAAGMPYDGALIDRRIEALIYMFPLQLGDEPVVWWD